MLCLRFFRLLTIVVILVSVVSDTIDPEDSTSTATAECVAGECPNPDAPETAADAQQETRTLVEDPKCPSRELVIRCAGKTLDTNGNGKLERAELQKAIDGLPWYSRGILKILGSVDKMMLKCDLDGDDAISMDYDMKNNQETCLATCFKRRAFKKSFFPDCE